VPFPAAKMITESSDMLPKLAANPPFRNAGHRH
jgi:hypothetical protein